MSPLEVLLIVTLVAVALPYMARRGGISCAVRCQPLLLFLTFVVLSIAYGAAREAGSGPVHRVHQRLGLR